MIIDAAAIVVATIAHGQAGDGDLAREDIEDAKVRAAGSAPLDQQTARPRPRDDQVLVDQEFAAGQRNGVASGKVNCLAWGCAGDRIAQ